MNDSRDIFGNTIVRIAVIGTLAILALFLFVQTASVATGIGRPANPATDTITVTGQGEASMPPNIATISFTVEHTESTVGAAQQKTTERVNAALSHLEDGGIEKKDIRTVSYNIYPLYEQKACGCDGRGRCTPCDAGGKIANYRVSHSVEVKVRDIDKAGALIGGLGEIGVQNLSGPTLALDEPNAGYNAARAQAIIDAKRQAEELAGQLGVRLGRIVNFSESSPGTYPKMYTLEAMGRGGDMAVAPTPEIPVGENTYSANVSITYEIR